MPSTDTVSSQPSFPERAVWRKTEAKAIYEMPFNDLLFEAHSVHRANFDPNQIQLSKLLSIKTGGCPEDCGYCSQSAHAATGLTAEKLMDAAAVLAAAAEAKAAGSRPFFL